MRVYTQNYIRGKQPRTNSPSTVIKSEHLQTTPRSHNVPAAPHGVRYCPRQKRYVFSRPLNALRYKLLSCKVDGKQFLPLLRCPSTFASKIRLIQSSSSRRCTCPYHLSLASRTLSVIHATPRMRRMSSFLFLSLKVRPRIHRNILISVLSKRSSSRLLSVHASEP